MSSQNLINRLDVHEAAGLRLSQAELQAALDGLPALERQALERAAERIRRYHEHQRTSSWMPARQAAASTAGLRTPSGVGTTITSSFTPATWAGMAFISTDDG